MGAEQQTRRNDNCPPSSLPPSASLRRLLTRARALALILLLGLRRTREAREEVSLDDIFPRALQDISLPMQ